MTMNMAKSFPKKIITLETGLVNRGTKVPFSYSPERLYMPVTIANKIKAKLPTLKDTAKYGFCSTPNIAGKTKLTDANTKARTIAPMNIFLRMFHSIS